LFIKEIFYHYVASFKIGSFHEFVAMTFFLLELFFATGFFGFFTEGYAKNTVTQMKKKPVMTIAIEFLLWI
jgi:hypothetical protein